MKALLLCGGLLVAGLAQGEELGDSPPVSVTQEQGPRIFHHLESAGRKNIAVAGDVVAVAWEDNHAGKPAVYAAFKSPQAPAFSPERRVSGAERDAYEPVVAALPGGRFLFAWEEGDGVWARIGDAHGFDAPIRLAQEANQASVAVDGSTVYAVWAQRRGRYRGIDCARLAPDRDRLALAAPARPVDAKPLAGDQLYPSVAVAADGGAVVAWEDRRLGHTVIMAARGERDLRFASPFQINETHRRIAGMGYGGGTGAMRVTLARAGEAIAALWMDKRNFTAGYDVYAAVSRDGGRHFGKNEKVQDDFGDAYAQWHGTLAANGTRIVAVWDDDRDGNADVWMAQRGADGWSDNVAIPGASGDGEQGSPAIAFDAQGNLHLVWLAKTSADAPDRLEYMRLAPPRPARQ